MCIYDKHCKAFSRVSAGALVVDGAQVGTLAFKYPADGAGRLTCFLHIHGSEMVSGSASGYGYDKKGAAFESAVSNLDKNSRDPVALRLIDLCSDIGGLDFYAALRNAGIVYFSAI